MKNTLISINRVKPRKKSCFADIRGFYGGSGSRNINITYVLEYLTE